jgi:phage FluMu protein Com
MTTLEQNNGLTLLDVVGYGECPRCKTERDLAQGKTIECAFCGKEKKDNLAVNED